MTAHDHDLTERCFTCREWPDWWLDLAIRISNLGVSMTGFANDQAHLDADVTALTTAVGTAIAELKAVIAANPSAPVSTLDFTALDALVSTEQAEATADAPASPPSITTPPPASDAVAVDATDPGPVPDSDSTWPADDSTTSTPPASN